MNVFEIALAVVGAIVLSYVLVRVASVAYYRTKRESFRAIMRDIKQGVNNGEEEEK